MTTKSFTPDDPALPINYPGFVFRMLRDEGYPAEALLADTGLEEAHLRDPHFRCAFQPLRQLFLNAIEHTENPHLGVTLALRFQPTYIGLPAYTAMNAPFFRDGLDILARYFFLNFPAFELMLLDKQLGLRNGEAGIRLRSKFPFSGIEYFAFSSAIVAINGLLKAMLRMDQVACRAEMTVSRPEGWAPLENTIGFPIDFETDENHIVFSAALLDRPLPGSDPINHARLVALCDQFAHEMAFESTPVTQVLAFLESAPSLNVSLSGTAAALGYSERDLRRRLNRSGTSYRQLADQVRERRARKLLSGTTQPVKVIAGALGFESSSNFSRSFKRWTGLTPRAYREQVRTPARDGAGRY